METQRPVFDPFLRRARRLSIATLVMGILAVFPYVCWLIWTLYNLLLRLPSEALFSVLIFLQPLINFIGNLALLGCFSGLLFGFISLLTGLAARGQLDEGEGPQERRRIKIGWILSGVAGIAHLLFFFSKAWLP